MREVEGGVARLWRMYEDIYTTHRHVTGLALQGEAAAGWSCGKGQIPYASHENGLYARRTRTTVLYNHTWRRNRHSASLSCRKDTILVAIMETHREQWKRAAMGKRLAKDLPGAVKEATRRGSEKRKYSSQRSQNRNSPAASSPSPARRNQQNEAYRPVRPYPETLYDQRERKLK